MCTSCPLIQDPSPSPLELLLTVLEPEERDVPCIPKGSAPGPLVNERRSEWSSFVLAALCVDFSEKPPN